jgi:hypothetical protein
MLKSKIAEVLRTFSTEEHKSFRNYIISPFHNSNKNVIKLFELARKYSPEYDSPCLLKENLFMKLYPGKKYSDIVMRILLSDLLRLSEEFLAYIRYSKEPFAEEKYLLEELTVRKLESLFNKHIKESEELMKTGGNIDDSYFLKRFYIEAAKVDFLISKDRQIESGEALLRKGEYLVDFFLMNALNITTELWEHEEVFNAGFGFNLTGEFFKNTGLGSILSYMKENNHVYYPVIEIYYYLFMCSKNEADDKYYVMLKESVIKNLELLTRGEQYNLLLGLESCCVSRLRLGITRSYNDLMEVYELMLSNDIFSQSSKDYMQANLFRNIFYTAVMQKRYDWAEKFAIDYNNYLLPEQRTDMNNYTTALVSFEKKKFETALEHISRVNYGFFVFKFEAKILMLKIYYELKSFEPGLSLIDSFAHFLLNNKRVSETYREPFMNFLKFLKLLIKASNNKNVSGRFDIAELSKKASETKHLISKKWILEKACELEKSPK